MKLVQCQKLNKRNFCPVRHGTGVALQAKSMDVSQNPEPNTAASETPGNEEGKSAARKSLETRGYGYVMWSMMTKLKHVQQAAADSSIPTE